MAHAKRNIWNKVDYDLVDGEDEASEGSTPSPEERAADRRAWRRARLVLDVVGSVFWIYLILKVFVTDVDREVVNAIAPGAGWLVDFRFLFFLAAAALVVLVAGKKYALIGVFYVLFFPLIVLGWKLPKAIYKTKSWISFFAVVNVVAAVIANFKYVILATTTAAFAVVFILATNSRPLIGLGMTALAALLLLAYVRTLRLSTKASGFINIQQRALERIRKADRLPQIATIDDELRDAEVVRFNSEQQTQFLTKLQTGVLVQRLSLFWAYQLEQYRQSAAPLLFNTLAYVWLVLQSVVCLTLINYGLYKLDHHAFNYTDLPSLLVFGRYVLASVGGSEIGALQAANSLADTISIATTLLGILFVIGLAVGFILSFRQKSQDDALVGTIEGIKNQSRQLERQLQREYEVSSVEEAFEQLEKLRAGLLGLINFFSSRIPPGFEDETGDRGV